MRRWVLILATAGALLAAACGPAPASAPTSAPPPAPTRTPTLSPTLTQTPALTATLQELYQYALGLINRDRQEAGLAPVSLGSNTAAQKHAEEEMAKGYISHWGMDGMKPYVRYTLAGGFNYEAENLSGPAILVTGVNYATSSPWQLLDEAETGLMESPGHRANILDKWHKKVNLGIAYSEYTLALVQQFEGDYIKFTQLPTLEGGVLSMSGETLQGFVMGRNALQIFYDQSPHPLTLGQLGKTDTYDLGEPVAFVRPPPPPGSYYPPSAETYTWETQGADPYDVPPDTPPPTPATFETEPPTVARLWTVQWVEAKRWDVSGSSFSIEVDMSPILAKSGKGVYTVYFWAQKDGESARLTNYSVFVS